MIKKALTLLFVLAISVGNAQEFTQKEETKVSFKIKNFGVYVDGDFSKVQINTNFNSKNLASSYINATIEVKSIATGIKKRDKHILEEGYFDEPNYKNITLKSTKIEKKSDGTFSMTAELNIKNTSKKIEVPLEVKEEGNSISIKSNFEINRRDYKVGGGSLVMSKKVKIQVEYLGTK